MQDSAEVLSILRGSKVNFNKKLTEIHHFSNKNRNLDDLDEILTLQFEDSIKRVADSGANN